jgi:DNA modification methylase
MSGRQVTASPPALPPLYGELRRWGLIQADALGLLHQLPDASVDAIVTDPPYGLSFGGHGWDGGSIRDGLGFQAFTRWWAEPTLRVLKPGGYLAAFGAPRTVHRLVAGLEDAGLEIRDQLLWIYGSGVPKSRRMAGGLGSALKPAYEPIVLARRPLDPAAGTIAANIARHGTGALNIGAARPPRGDRTGEGYWPSHVTLTHEPDCDETAGDCVPTCVVPLIDRLAAPHRSKDAPSFSRLFYAAKASRAEREAGLKGLPEVEARIFSGSDRRPRRNVHPTVKPIGLMRWLVRLVAPDGGLVLDPFAGSGSTGIAAVLEDRQFVGIEREAVYVEIARARIRHSSTSQREDPSCTMGAPR